VSEIGASLRRYFPARVALFIFWSSLPGDYGAGHPENELQGGRMTDQIPSNVNQSGLSDNAAGGLAYVTFIPAIIFLIVAPFNSNPYVRFHSWQSIFLNIAWFVVDVVLMIVGRIPVLGWSTVFLWPLVALGFFILWIVVLIKAFNGERFKVPFIGDLAEKQANS
jgi:uncharacterized membrane protein